ncbi:MAG: glycerophosphodiester phosphodiesterase family protein [Candidatus Hydrogenedentes bacterium]|nr:glycerophosphodiester phosphodiesterase family protein [Candidatus Hydrogenedentota bacterium]
MRFSTVFAVSVVLFVFVLFVAVAGDGNIEGVRREYAQLGVHRGGKGLYPENTIFAYTESTRRWKGCLLEGDIRLTKDGVAVLIHDATVDRTTDGTGNVAEKTVEELKMLDAGYRFTTDGGNTYPFRGKGIAIPTLEEVLESFPSETFLFEIKVPLEDLSAVVEPILKRKMEGRVYLASFYAGTIQKIRKNYPMLMTCYTIADAGGLINALRNGGLDKYSPPAQMLAMSPDLEKDFQLTPDNIESIRRKGVKVLVFTVNTQEYMEKYLREYEIDWILTDYPDRYESLVKSFK